MATNYPGAVDNFTNPQPGDSQDNPSHAEQHTDVNDAIVAVQTVLGTGYEPGDKVIDRLPPDPSAEADDRILLVDDGGLVYGDAPDPASVVPTGDEDDLVALDSAGGLKAVDSGAYVTSDDVDSIVLVEEGDWPPDPEVEGVLYVKVEDT